MADDQDNPGFLQENPGDLRIPISITIPWRRTLGGQLWPLDRKGQYWPEDRWGHPECPLNELPPGFAPGTGKKSPSIGASAQSYLAYLDAEKAAYENYGSQPIPTLTVRPEGIGAAHPAHSHRPGAAAGAGRDTRAAGLGTMTLMVGDAVIATGAASVILEGLAALMVVGAVVVAAEVVIDWLGKRRRFADAGAAAAFVRHAEEHEALIPAPPTPVLPPPPPPPMKGDNPGFDPAPPVPPQPGFTPAPPSPLVPPETTPGSAGLAGDGERQSRA